MTFLGTKIIVVGSLPEGEWAFQNHDGTLIAGGNVDSGETWRVRPGMLLDVKSASMICCAKISEAIIKNFKRSDTVGAV